MAAVPTAVEDYVKVIYSHTEWQPEPITTSVLAARLGLANSSVTEMVKKLIAQGLVTHRPYGAIELTRDGTTLALRMVRRHRLIETWLVQHVGYTWDQVHDEAEVLEHSMSDRLLDALDAQLGHPTRDPHGDPIPTAEGTLALPEARLLAELEPGESGVVVRISDRDPLVLRHLEAEGIALDTQLDVIGRGESTSTIAIDHGRRELGRDALVSIWVGPLSA